MYRVLVSEISHWSTTSRPVLLARMAGSQACTPNPRPLPALSLISKYHLPLNLRCTTAERASRLEMATVRPPSANVVPATM